MKKTLATLLLDRSGSMRAVKAQTIEGINAWLSELRASPADTRLSLVQFDYNPIGGDASGVPRVRGSDWIRSKAGVAPAVHGLPHGPTFGPDALAHDPGRVRSGLCLEKTFEAVKASEVRDLRPEDFSPRGSTPLIDAVIATVEAIETAVADRPDIQVILVVQTDGMENASRNNWETLRRKVSEKEEMGWEILFMGGGIDAYDQGSRMGADPGKTVSYNHDPEMTRAAFRQAGANCALYASGMAATTSFSQQDKAAAGDTSGGAS